MHGEASAVLDLDELYDDAFFMMVDSGCAAFKENEFSPGIEEPFTPEKLSRLILQYCGKAPGEVELKSYWDEYVRINFHGKGMELYDFIESLNLNDQKQRG